MNPTSFTGHELPVLMYHRLVTQASGTDRFSLQVTVDDFERQLDWLQKWGHTPVTFQDLDGDLPRKPLILTFDDGYEDNYFNLFPILKRRGVKAVVYVLGDRSIRRNEWDILQGEPALNLLTDEQVVEMGRSGFVEIGSHSMTHAKLTELPGEVLRRQVEDSKKSLEKLLGTPVGSFAYPYGYVNPAVKEAVGRAGYRFGLAVHSGPTAFNQDLLEIRRHAIGPRTHRWKYWKQTSGWYFRYRKIFRP
ncbi:MAG TPA: polysaccharide deacetylase family protein [bacterium]|nr:polysaccharide deacetylase family protein [bacterium]